MGKMSFTRKGPEGAPDKLARLEGTGDQVRYVFWLRVMALRSENHPEVAKMSGGIAGESEPAILTRC